MKVTLALLSALAIVGGLFAVAAQYRDAPRPAIPAEFCNPVRVTPLRDGGEAMVFLCKLPLPRRLNPQPDITL